MTRLRRTTAAVLSWVLTLAVVALGIVAARRGEVAWAGLAGLVAAVALAPVFTTWRATNVPPWPLLVVATTPVAIRTVSPSDVDGLEAIADLRTLPEQALALLTTFADAAALAAIALLVVAVLQQFTAIRMTTRFGMLFVVVTTVGLAGFWAVARWAGERYLDLPTDFVASNRALMVEFATILAAGFTVALLFGPYFCRARPAGDER